MRLLVSVCLLSVAGLCAVGAVPLLDASSSLQLKLAFDEPFGASSFKDTSAFSRSGRCSLTNPACPVSGDAGKKGNSVYFGKFCAHNNEAVNGLGDPANRGGTILDGANCGNRIDFNPVTFKDGTVMLWYKEDGTTQTVSLPVLAGSAPAPSDPTSQNYQVWRNAVGNGWDLSLVGGNGLSLGRISAQYWGGYWCGQWHVAQADRNARGGQSPKTTSADRMAGWDHLEWHHYAMVFSGSTAMVYVDGVRVAVFRNTAVCQKSASFLGERTVRYTAQNGVRETEMTGLSSDRPRQNDAAAGALNQQLQAMDWSMNFYKGHMDDVRIYNKVLTEDQLVAAMNDSG